MAEATPIGELVYVRTYVRTYVTLLASSVLSRVEELEAETLQSYSWGLELHENGKNMQIHYSNCVENSAQRGLQTGICSANW